jgi:PKHD-type hydroxylase
MGFGDEMQYTKYYGTNKGHYSWHGDVGPGVSHRKLSLVLQLTDPSEYEGGELEISIGSRTLTVPKVKNSLAVFPSFVLHRVLPVTQGERRSLVTWISGQNYM